MACTQQGVHHRAESATAFRYSGSPNHGDPIASRSARRRDDGRLPGELLLSSAIQAAAALTSSASVFACPPSPSASGASASSTQARLSNTGRGRQLDDVGELADNRDRVAVLAPEVTRLYPGRQDRRYRHAGRATGIRNVQ
jgi:hypothetical protein